MGILIDKNIDMPENCWFCFFHEHLEGDEDHFDFHYCAIENYHEACTPTPMTPEEMKQGRREWCPLRQVP